MSLPSILTSGSLLWMATILLDHAPVQNNREARRGNTGLNPTNKIGRSSKTTEAMEKKLPTHRIINFHQIHL
jgi:hypothetical protein